MPKIKSPYPGVRYTEHVTRKHGKKPDRYFSVRYGINKIKTEQGLGWASEGWTEKKAFDLVCQLKQNAKSGTGPVTIAEMQKQKTEGFEAPTLSDFVSKKYLPSCAQTKKSHTNKNEGYYINKWILPQLGKMLLSDIKTTHVEQLRNTVISAGRSNRTVSYVISLLRHIFNYAVSIDHHSGQNPAAKIKLPRSDNQRLRFLSRPEAETLLAAIKESSGQLYHMCLISLYCGLRAGEIFALTPDCMDFERGTILIKDPKNKKNRRSYMPEKVAAELKEYLADKTGLLFPSRSGDIAVQVSDTFNRTVDRIGLNKDITDRRDKVVFHTLRHTFASWLAEAGIDLYTIKELMGHSTIKMTERYAHLSPNKMREAVKALEL